MAPRLSSAGVPTIPTTVNHVLDTFHHTLRCPITGFRNTISGTYETITEAVNTRHGTSYNTADIGWALTWLHENGPDHVGATITKCGPGNRKTEVVFDNPKKAPVIVEGNVYMLVIDGNKLPHEQLRLIGLGLSEWCDYRLSSVRNDIIDVSMYRAAIPTSDAASRDLRRDLQKSITEMAAEINVLNTLKVKLTKMTV